MVKKIGGQWTANFVISFYQTTHESKLLKKETIPYN